MAQVDVQGATKSGVAVWIFRALLVAAAAYMVYTWFQPWWGADFAVIPGNDHLLMRPWGVEAVAQVRANADAEMWSMPWFFAPFMWTYLGVCMLLLAVSLFVERRISLGRIKLPVATILIALVGLSYLFAVGMAWGVGELRAGWVDSNFIGKSTIKHPMTGTKIKMVSDLKDGYWLALASGPVFIVLALLRGLFVRTPKA